MRMDEAGSCCVHAFQIICRLLLRLKFRIPVFWMRTKRPGPDTHSLIHQSRYLPFSLSLSFFLFFFSSHFRRDVCEVLVGKISLSQNFWNLKAYLGDNRGEYRYIFPSSFFLFSSSSSSFPKRLQQISLSSFRIFDLTLNLEDDVMFFRQNGKKIFRMERKCKEFYNSSILYYVHLYNYQRMSNLFEYRLKIIPPKNFSPIVYCSNLSHMRRYRQSKLDDIRRSSEPP